MRVLYKLYTMPTSLAEWDADLIRLLRRHLPLAGEGLIGEKGEGCNMDRAISLAERGARTR